MIFSLPSLGLSNGPKMITVYLDSNDYSNFATAKPDSEVWEIKKQFLKYKKAGKVAFVFSIAGVAEAVPIGSGLKHAASYERLMIIEELCGSRSLKSIFEAVDEEVLASIDCQSFCPNGPWLSSDFSLRVMADEVADFAIRAFCVANGIQLSYKFVFDHHYRSNPEYRESVLSGFFGKMNLSKPKRRELFGTPKEKISLKGDLEFLLKEALLNKKSLAETLKTEGQMAFCLSSAIRNPGEMMASSLNAAIGKQELDENWDEIQRWMREDGLLLRLFSRFAQKAGAKMISGFSASEIRAQCPGFSLMIDVLVNSSLERVAASKGFVSNQVVDAMHAFYAPYVDLFKADKYTARIIRGANPNINVYSSLADLNEELVSRLG